MSVCLVALGSNEGDRQATLEAAVAQLRQQPGIEVASVSRWRETVAVGGPATQPTFLNGAVKLDTSLSPQPLLAALQRIETRLGRRRDERWGPRTLDLDLLLYDTLTLDSPLIVVPHPRMAWRRFVLEPAAEVAAEMLHPTTGWTIGRLLEHLNTTPPYVAITGPIAAGKTHLATRLAAAIPARLIEEQPDWARLDAFYAEPARHAWQTEMDFLRQRAELLTQQNHASDERPLQWIISDFWFDQSLAFARAWLEPTQLAAFNEQYRQSRQGVIRPRLIVVADAPVDELLSRVCSRGRRCEKPITHDQLERIRQSVLDQIRQPDVGPVFYAPDGNRADVFTEVLAAVRSME